MRGKIFGVLLLVSAACAGPAGDSTSGTATPSASEGALDITLPTLEGDDVTLTASTPTDVFVLPFWKTSCEPCRGQLAELDEVYAALEGRGLQVWAVNVDPPDTQAQVPGYVQRASYHFPTLVDYQTEVYARFNPRGDCPFYVVLDAQGEVLMTHAGYTKGDVTESLRAYLEERLAPTD